MPPPSSSGQADDSLSYLWILVAIFAALIGIWYFAHNYIVYGYLQLKSAEISVINLFTSRLKPVQEWIRLVPAEQVTFTKLTLAANLVGSYFRLPVAVLLFILAIILYRSDPIRKCKRAYNMKTLLLAQRHNWPKINPVAHLDLVNTPALEGPWSMALTPMEFCKKYKLIEIEASPLKEGQLKREQETIAKVLRGKANKMFTMQLGPSFSTVDHLSIHVKALAGIFIARANRDRKGADQLLQQIAVSSVDGKLNLAGAEELCNKHKDSKLMRMVCERHAYVLTMMASLLELARMDGVLAVAEFLWLKPVDRRLWYMLSSVGRQTPFTEVAGPFAHWLAEKELGQKIVTPMIDEATNALELAMNELVYIPDEEPEQSSVGKA